MVESGDTSAGRSEREAPQAGVCRGCPQEDSCRTVWSAENSGPLTAGGMVLASMAAFLVPLGVAAAGAVIGAAAGGQGEFTWHVGAGAVAGLAVGAAAGAGLVRVIRRRMHV